jgi:hypothetical protein
MLSGVRRSTMQKADTASFILMALRSVAATSQGNPS